MIYTKYMLTPGVEWPDREFTPKADFEEADEAVQREGEGTTAYSLMGFDPEGERWEVLMIAYKAARIVRRTRMMFGIKLEWDGSVPMEFDRGAGIEIEKYVTNSYERVIRFGGLMVGMMAAQREDEILRAQELANRLGVVIKES
jgi:hypothetical protein